MYYVLDRSWAMHPARVDDESSYDDQDVWWDDGQRFTKTIKTPVEMSLEPYQAGSRM